MTPPPPTRERLAGMLAPPAVRPAGALESAKRSADKERATLAKAPATLAAAKTGDEMVAVGKLYFSAGQYAQSADALRKGIARGGVADLDAANMLLGIALVRQGKHAEAAKAFDAIKNPTFAEIGRLWKLRAR